MIQTKAGKNEDMERNADKTDAGTLKIPQKPHV